MGFAPAMMTGLATADLKKSRSRCLAQTPLHVQLVSGMATGSHGRSWWCQFFCGQDVIASAFLAEVSAVHLLVVQPNEHMCQFPSSSHFHHIQTLVPRSCF